MSSDVIQAVAQLQASALGGPGRIGLEGGAAPATQAVQGPSFGDMVTGALQKVNDHLLTSQTDLQQLAVGNVENLHQIMIRLEESRLSFQLVMQVRNRLLEAYQDLMRMQL